MSYFSLRSGLFCVLWAVYVAGCILWGNDFAKIHVSFPGFPAPIFIGELLLLSGMLCTLPDILNSNSRVKKVILLFSTLLFVVTVMGFMRYGPLALRHAAMFAYLFFGFFLYQHSANTKIIVLIGFMLYAVFLPIRFGLPGSTFCAFSVWAFVCYSLDTILQRGSIGITKRLIGVAVFAILTLPLYLLFHTARTFMIANCVSLLCLIGGISMIVRFSAMKRVIFSVFCLSIILACVYFFSDRNAVLSIVNFKDMGNKIELHNSEYERLKQGFVLQDVPVSIYRPVHKEDEHVRAIKLPIVNLPVAVTQTSVPITPTDISVKEAAATQASVPITPTDISVKEAAVTQTSVPITAKTELRSYENMQQNFLFRIFIWKGLFEELFEKRAFFGFGLGKPLRPMITQVLGWTDGLYHIDGWVSAHNSWFHLIYLFGIIGVFMVLAVWFAWGHMFLRAVRNKDIWGVFLSSALCGWMVGANAQPLLEQPHYVIFFWGLWGIVFRKVYAKQEQK